MLNYILLYTKSFFKTNYLANIFNGCRFVVVGHPLWVIKCKLVQVEYFRILRSNLVKFLLQILSSVLQVKTC